MDGKFLSGPVYETRVKVKGGIPLSLALGVAFGLITFIVIILISAFCFWKRRNPAYLQVVRMEDGTGKYNFVLRTHITRDEVEKYTIFSSMKLYII